MTPLKQGFYIHGCLFPEPDSSCPLFRIIGVMAALTQGLKVVIVAVLWSVVEVSHCQDDSGFGDWVRLVVFRAAPLAFVTSTRFDAL